MKNILRRNVYARRSDTIIGEYSITVTWDAGDVHLGYCYINSKKTHVSWNYESDTWTVE